jgi:hypothetical protein
MDMTPEDRDIANERNETAQRILETLSNNAVWQTRDLDVQKVRA